jgi:membrane-bound lytic murein transglycosylase B
VISATGEPQSPYFQALLDSLSSGNGDGAPVTRDEFLHLLYRPEAKRVYADQLIKYATPKSVDKQNETHADYQRALMKQKKLQAGVDFLARHDSLLAEAERRYGVARKDIVSILMWETGLGRYTGKYRVFNIFMGQLLYLDLARERAVAELKEEGELDPSISETPTAKELRRFSRIKWRAVKNLAALVRKCQAEGTDPLHLRGSWGGAVGYVQFMPYRFDLAVDGDADGKTDLYTWPDAIMSAANYLRVLGEYRETEKARRRAIYRYNPSQSYVDGVVAYADAIWKRYQ